jgi:hypothetical protein
MFHITKIFLIVSACRQIVINKGDKKKLTQQDINNKKIKISDKI